MRGLEVSARSATKCERRIRPRKTRSWKEKLGKAGHRRREKVSGRGRARERKEEGGRHERGPRAEREGRDWEW